MRGQRRVEVALEHHPVDRSDVAARAGDRDGVDVDRVQLDVGVEGLRERDPQRTGAAAEVEDHHGLVGREHEPHQLDQPRGLVDEELGAQPRDEHPGVDLDAQPAERRPADDDLQRLTGRTTLDHRGELDR